MAKFQGKRMVPESLIAKIGQGGGTEYTAGEGIDITNNEISANIKAGSGIVVDTDLTDESLVVMVDQEDIPYKSDLATVATTGDYDDLTNKPTNLVTTDTQQDITGKKTFIGTITAPLEIKGANGENGTIRFKGENDFTGPMIYGSYGIGLHLKPRVISEFQIEDNSNDHKFVLPSKANGTYTLATSDDIPAAVSGTNDGTNWTSLTVGSDTYDIPAGGSGSSYTFTNGLTENAGTVSWDLNNKFNYSTYNRSLVSTDAQNFDANNLAQNSVAYIPCDSFSFISNDRYNNSFVGFGLGLSTHDVGSPQDRKSVV